MMWLIRFTHEIYSEGIDERMIVKMTKFEMLNAITELGYYPYNTEYDSYEEVRKEYLFLNKETRRIRGKNALRDLIRRD